MDQCCSASQLICKIQLLVTALSRLAEILGTYYNMLLGTRDRHAAENLDRSLVGYLDVFDRVVEEAIELLQIPVPEEGSHTIRKSQISNIGAFDIEVVHVDNVGKAWWTVYGKRGTFT